MKKIFTYSLVVMIAAVLPLSCVRESIDTNDVENAKIDRETVTVTCVFDAPDTKVDIGEGTGVTQWTAGVDQILIHGKKTSENVTVTITNEMLSPDKKIATFSVSLPATKYYADESESNPNGIYAAYPASAYIEYSDGRGYYYNSFNNTNLPLMSASFDADNNKFVFHNLCGILSFKVSGGSAYDEYMLSGMSGENLGYGKYVVKTIHGQTPNYLYSGDTPKKVIRGAVVADGVTENRIFIPNGVNFSEGFYLYLLKDGVIVKQLKYTGPISIPRNSYRPLKGLADITSNLTDFVEPTHTPASWTEAATDISTTLGGRANCYWLKKSTTPSESKYKFPAKKGNSATAVTGIASIDVEWETFNNSSSISKGKIVSKVDYDSGWIYFQMPETVRAGNALIAVRDVYGNILWSWHIWVPTDDVTSAAYTDFIGGNMMNMNLGALEAVPTTGAATIESLGLLYQWGRKDPFVGAREWKRYPSKAKVAGVSWSKVDVPAASIDEAIKNPTTYYHVNESDAGDWNTTHNNNLWNDSGNKTMYDPCPPGYKVPVYDNTKTIWIKTDSGWIFDAENHVTEHTASAIRLPMAGYISAWGGGLEGTGPKDDAPTDYRNATLVWSATAYDDSQASCILVRMEKSPKYYNAYRGKANAGSVRCVAE